MCPLSLGVTYGQAQKGPNHQESDISISLPSGSPADQLALAKTVSLSSALMGGPIGLRSWDAAIRASSSMGGNVG